MTEHLLREIVSFVTVQPPQFHETTNYKVIKYKYLRIKIILIV